MVCIYCHSETKVINSRHQKRENQVWRRRHCLACNTVFTTEEAADLSGSIRVAQPSTKPSLEPFSRDVLFLSIYRSLGHRQDAIEAAGALCSTVTGKVLQETSGALIDAPVLAQLVHETLHHFDRAAGVSYAAYHKLAIR